MLFGKKFVIYLDKGGVLTILDRETQVRRGALEGLLPVISTDTQEEAEAIQLTFCRCAYEKDVHGKNVYVLNEIGNRAIAGLAPELDIKELPEVGARFQHFLERRALNRLAEQEETS